MAVATKQSLFHQFKKNCYFTEDHFTSQTAKFNTFFYSTYLYQGPDCLAQVDMDDG